MVILHFKMLFLASLVVDFVIFEKTRILSKGCFSVAFSHARVLTEKFITHARLRIEKPLTGKHPELGNGH